MYLFQRLVTLRGGYRTPIAWANEITTYVNEHSGLEVSLWVANFGLPLGTVGWSARVDSRDRLAGATAELMGQDGYHELVERGQEFVDQPGQDHLLRRIHPAEVPDAAPPVGSVATVISATPAEGRIGQAIGWGVEIATRFTATSGAPAALYADSYGTFGQLTWIAVHADMAAVDAADDALAGDADYLAAIDGAGDLFVPASGQRGLVTRIA